MRYNLRTFIFLCFSIVLPHISYSQDSILANDENLDEVRQLVEVAISYQISDLDSCRIYAKKAIDLAEEIHYQKPPLIVAYLLITDVYWKRSEYKKALEYAHSAKSLSNKLDDKKRYAHSIIVIADIYLDIGGTDQKFDLLFQGLDISTQLDDIKGMAHAYSSIGSAYHEEDNIDKALKYYLKSLETAQEINHLYGILRALNNIGSAYGSLGNFEQEKTYYLESVNIAQKMQDELLIGVIYSNLSRTYRDLNIMDSSFYYIKQAQEVFINGDHKHYLAESHVRFALNYLKTNQFEKGLTSAHTALEISQTYQLKKNIVHAAKALQQLYDTTGNTEKAYQYALIYHNLKDSLTIETTDVQLAQIEMKYAYEQTLLEKESEQKHKRLIYITIFTIIVALMSLALMTIYFRSKIRETRSIQEKMQLESELDIKHKELATNTMSLLKTNKTLNEISDHLIEVLNYDNLNDTQSAVNSIVSSVKQATKSKVWKEFEMRFQQVHNNFNENLLASFPHLTALDLRLCALLRLNLTTKEISELTGQRTSSLEIARSRLRKKLGITDRSTNLVVFLSAF